MNNTISKFIKENESELYRLLKELCAIPAPSGMEDERAKYCKEWLDSIGAVGTYIDAAKNVIFPFCCEGKDDLTVVVAHTDTVFPDLEPMPYSDDGKIIRCPGVGDDTASLSVMLLTVKFLVENNIKSDSGILFVANSCEEGLGNLKGTRRIFEDYKGRIKDFVSFDSHTGVANDRCVGSHRYEVTVKTEGGHSFQSFGKKNAIAVLSKIVSDIYEIIPPKKEGARASYNVGTISGGTSVNTIAQNATMLCEYRSDDNDCLEFMRNEFLRIFDSAKCDDAEIIVNKVGDRPCANGVDEGKIRALVNRYGEAVKEVLGKELLLKSASTDCNIPLSLGIPAVCVGVYVGGGAHTREEWIEKASIIPGLDVAIRFILKGIK